MLDFAAGTQSRDEEVRHSERRVAEWQSRAYAGDGFVVSERGRPFLRTIAARFDAYLAPDAARHSAAV